MEEIEKLSGEQAADLAALQAGVAETAPAAPEAAAGPVGNPADSWAVIPAMVGSLLVMMMPEVKGCFSPAACQAWGEAMVPVADEQGWNHEEVLGPKLALAVATMPFIVGPALAIKARKQAAAAPRQVENKPAPGALVADPGAGVKTVTFGAPVANENG